MKKKKRESSQGRLMTITCFSVLLVIISALSVIDSSFQGRQLFNAVQQEYRETYALEEQWSRLLLERSTWAAPSRIEQLAKSDLNMVAPDPVVLTVMSP